MLVRYPERFEAGRRCDDPVSLVDVVPTCLAAAGLEKSPDHVGGDLAKVAGGDSDRDAIIGQLAKDESGLYMLLTREYKYIYSAADRKEYFFRRDPGRLDERNLADNAAFAPLVNEYRQRLISWFREDGYEDPLDGDGWREFSNVPTIPDTPDAGQLFQDGRSVSSRFPDGYSPRVDTMRG